MSKSTLLALILTLPAALFCIWAIAAVYEHAMNKQTMNDKNWCYSYVSGHSRPMDYCEDK